MTLAPAGGNGARRSREVSSGPRRAPPETTGRSRMDSLIDQGAELALVGMATVFAFLAALVLVVRAMSALAAPGRPRAAPRTAGEEGDDPRLAAAAAAVARHRARNGRGAP